MGTGVRQEATDLGGVEDRVGRQVDAATRRGSNKGWSTSKGHGMRGRRQRAKELRCQHSEVRAGLHSLLFRKLERIKVHLRSENHLSHDES